MNKTTAERVVERFAHHGYIIHGASFHILRWHGQGMMNKAAGEAAPTWELRANPLWKHSRVIANGEHPRVAFRDGEVHTVEVVSHMPLTWLLKQSVDDWEIDFEPSYGLGRLTIFCNELPPSWV